MTHTVEILEGTYKVRGNDASMAGYRFPLVKPYAVDKNGVGYVTVQGGECYPPNAGVPDRPIRIRCEGAESYSAVDSTTDSTAEPAVAPVITAKNKATEETDEEIKHRLRQRFNVLHDMTQAVKEGNVRARDSSVDVDVAYC